MNRSLAVIALAGGCAVAALGEPYLYTVGEFGFDITGSVYGDSSTSTAILVQGRDGDSPANIQFTCDQIPNKLLVFSPCSSTTPQQVRITLDPNVVRTYAPGEYRICVSFRGADQPLPPTPFCNAYVDVTLTAPGGPFMVGAVVSAASLQPSISPGEVVAIFGSNLGPPILSSQPDHEGFYPTFFGNTTVTFNGIAAPVLFNNTGQINAVVPYAIAGQKTAQVVVSHYGQTSAAFSVPVADTSPGIFTRTQDGRGQGAILNAGAAITLNGATNPAPKGSIITLYATGAGLWNQPVLDGLVMVNVLQPPIVPKAAVSLTIGGQPAQILYAGAAPYIVSGVMQVNAVVPDGIGSGPQPIVLTIGSNNNSQQNVTVVVQ